MKFNWVFSGDDNPAMQRTCIDLEYSLRPRIMRFLLSKLDVDADFSSFHFDVNVDKKWVSISENTPQEYIQKILPDFNQAINGSSFYSVA
ncbi:hypothetical protein K1F50_07905 [Muricauda oceani]|uniref:Uncharacterized protein n=1 Tax=Flagellimonas oceani TaxID=2698672 RepID=A0A6G7J3T7_9FLAO|nr:hypothetical protein [Allomuricauda oceani]MBW8242722.1 hypothetical protein [Allomuricauda oceani]QII45541.1 hypothetical protein GVT53_12910 [Allomuricauda oceani]